MVKYTHQRLAGDNRTGIGIPDRLIINLYIVPVEIPAHTLLNLDAVFHFLFLFAGKNGHRGAGPVFLEVKQLIQLRRALCILRDLKRENDRLQPYLILADVPWLPHAFIKTLEQPLLGLLIIFQNKKCKTVFFHLIEKHIIPRHFCQEPVCNHDAERMPFLCGENIQIKIQIG